jgi:hypothetical protein
MEIEYTKGDLLGELMYIAPSESIGNKRCALFLCVCGNEFVTRIDRAKASRVKSCGCLTRQLVSTRLKEYYQAEYRPKTHGLTKHPLYRVWRGMKNRCHNPKSTSYKQYGGRGVTVCSEWRESFESFYSWAMQNGYQPDLELDKDLVGNGLSYSPETCCWLTPKQNARYKRSSQFCLLDGMKMTDKEASIALGYNLTYVYKVRHGLIPNKHPNLVLLDRQQLTTIH